MNILIHISLAYFISFQFSPILFFVNSSKASFFFASVIACIIWLAAGSEQFASCLLLTPLSLSPLVLERSNYKQRE